MIPVSLVNENTKRELRNHQQLSIHPHVIDFQGAFVSDQHLCIIMEYAKGGSLLQQIQQNKQYGNLNMSEDLCRWCFQQHILAMYFCHQMQVVNRDIKPDNMLVMWPVSFQCFNVYESLEGDLSNSPVLKLADFGYSKDLVQDSKPASVVGTLTHIAPEVLKNLEKKDNKSPYDAMKADIWSSGVALFELLTGTTPFQRVGDKEQQNMPQLIMNRILNVDYNFPQHCKKTICQEAKDLVGSMLMADPDQRITTLDIFQHPWFRKNFPIDDPVGWTTLYVNRARAGGEGQLSQEQLTLIMQQVEQQKQEELSIEQHDCDSVSDEQALRIRRAQRGARQRGQDGDSVVSPSIPMYTVKEVQDSNGDVLQQWVPTGTSATREVLRQKIIQHLQASGAMPHSQPANQQQQTSMMEVCESEKQINIDGQQLFSQQQEES